MGRNNVVVWTYVRGGPQWLKFGVSSPSPSSLSGNSLIGGRGRGGIKNKKGITHARSQFLAYFVSGSETATPSHTVQFKPNVQSQQPRQEFLYLDLNVLKECSRNKHDGPTKFISCSAIYKSALHSLVQNDYLGNSRLLSDKYAVILLEG